MLWQRAKTAYLQEQSDTVTARTIRDWPTSKGPASAPHAALRNRACAEGNSDVELRPIG